ncbi:MAG TPA: metallophosphoesterase, partial [Dissulfuribacter thermophilus]|nr:metallophosphoesterase [Dissulfuribacter thermophilus]
DYAVNAVRAEKWFNPQARTVVALTRRLLSEESLEFLKGLPLTIMINGALLVHGFPPNSFKTYLYMVPERGIKRVLSSLEQDIVFVGHTHELFSYRLKPTGELRVKPLVEGTIALYPGERYIINAGSVGQPRDGDPRAKYLVLDLDNRELTTKFIQYDWMRVAKMIIERGFPETYAKRLLGRRP